MKNKFIPLVVSIITLVIIFSCMYSCNAQAKPAVKDTVKYKLVYVGLSEYNKPMYNVVFSNGTVIEYMYMEEIKASIKSGKWQYNEDLVIKSKN